MMSNPLFIRFRPDVDGVALAWALEHPADRKLGVPRLPPGLAFMSARGALKWFLGHLRGDSGETLRVGLQAFTCGVVLQAILESGNTPVFFDIDFRWCSYLHGQIDYDGIDILILTHYSGYPNPDYMRISEECGRRNIILIEDLAQTVGAEVSQTTVGNAARVYLYSFGHDKPISCFAGGFLGVNDTCLLKELERVYEELPVEPEVKEVCELSRLREFHEITAPQVYTDARETKFWQDYRTDAQRWAGGGGPAIPVVRMGPRKHAYLSLIWALYSQWKLARWESALLARKVMAKWFGDVEFLSGMAGMQPTPCRLAAIAPEGQRDGIVKTLAERGIQVASLNWPELCFQGYPQCGAAADRYPNSACATRRILNLPIWSREIWDARC
jgi:dTDP-4-amino-4,6-dideoxygalactose transaminase